MNRLTVLTTLIATTAGTTITTKITIMLLSKHSCWKTLLFMWKMVIIMRLTLIMERRTELEEVILIMILMALLIASVMPGLQWFVLVNEAFYTKSILNILSWWLPCSYINCSRRQVVSGVPRKNLDAPCWENNRILERPTRDFRLPKCDMGGTERKSNFRTCLRHSPRTDPSWTSSSTYHWWKSSSDRRLSFHRSK